MGLENAFFSYPVIPSSSRIEYSSWFGSARVKQKCHSSSCITTSSLTSTWSSALATSEISRALNWAKNLSCTRSSLQPSVVAVYNYHTHSFRLWNASHVRGVPCSPVSSPCTFATPTPFDYGTLRISGIISRCCSSIHFFEPAVLKSQSVPLFYRSMSPSQSTSFHHLGKRRILSPRKLTYSAR